MSKLFYFTSVLVFVMACNQTTKNDAEVEVNYKYTVSQGLQKILKEHHVDGTILILDETQKQFWSNNFEKSKIGQLPASTFKIANTIIGLELDIINREGVVFPWDRKPRNMDIWHKDFDLKGGFQASCVPCYQELARKIGLDSMLYYLNKIGYDGMNVNELNLDNFWLRGISSISPEDQISFLKRLYESKIDIKPTTARAMKTIMLMEETDAFSLYGKTGWSITDGIDNGWFVGYYVIKEIPYYFACNIEPEIGFNNKNFWKTRKLVVSEAMEALGLLKNQ